MTSARRAPRWLWLTVPLALALVAAASLGLFSSGFYADNTPLMDAQLSGGDIASLALLLPLLVASALLAARGSARATLVWLGCLAFLTYFYLVFAFHVSHNAAFLLYLLLLGGSVYGLVFALPAAMRSGPSDATVSDRTARIASIALAIVPVLFYVTELGEIVPAALAGRVPEAVADFGAPTSFAYVIDMALALPAYAIAAVLLWRRRRAGYVLAGMMLTLVAVMMIALLCMFAVQWHRDIPVASADVAIIGTVATGYCALLVWYLRDFRLRAERR
jgi:hypothetical protein